jgi:hypothetical protein
MKFSEWLYEKDNAPDNNPAVAARGRFLALRQKIMDYVDDIEELGVPADEARTKILAAFRGEIESLPEPQKREIESIIKFMTGMIYRS